MTDPRAAKIIDDLLLLLTISGPRGNLPCFDAVEKGILYLMEAHREHPNLPATRLFEEMGRRGLIV